MAILRSHYNGPISFSCDTCGEVLDTDIEDFRDANEYMKDNDWRSIPPAGTESGKWEHRCGDCRAAHAEKRKSQGASPQAAPVRKGARMIVTRSLHRQILGYLHPDRTEDAETKLHMTKIFLQFKDIPVEYIDEDVKT